MSSLFNLITFDDRSSTPKYQQLANLIIEAVQQGKIKEGDVLPSLNELSFEFQISKDTVQKAYECLRDSGIVDSIPGKGFYIKSTTVDRQLRVLLLFNKLSPHKKIIYDTLSATISDHASIDLYIYNNDFSSFKKLLERKKTGYTHYVVIPHFVEGGENAVEVINAIDKNKLIVLDKLIPGLAGKFGAVYENFESDILNALTAALQPLRRYDTIKIVFPKDSYYPKEILNGCMKFCNSHGFKYQVVHYLECEAINEGEVFITLMEDDLVSLIERIHTSHFVIGRDVGVISYNETPVKKIILSGITTVSTDFKLMGLKTAEMILNNSKEHIEVPFYLTLRPSL